MKTEREILRDAEKILRGCLADVPFVRLEQTTLQADIEGERPDLVARLSLPEGELTIVIEAKTNGQPRIAREAAEQIERYVSLFPKAYGIFVAPFVSSRSAEVCTERNIGYLDLAGNCRLSFYPVYIKTVCDRNPFPRRRELRSLYGRGSLKARLVLRVLLNNPKRVWKTQELADEAGVSIGQIANVKKQLEDKEWVQTEASGFRLADPTALLSEWAENYDVRENRFDDFYSLKSVPEIESRLAEFCAAEGIRYALTGFSGGARLAPAVRYQRVTVIVEEENIEKVATGVNLKRVPTGPNVNLIVPVDTNAFYGVFQIEDAWIASSAQIYLDLRGLRARGDEAAEAVLREAIEPQWR